MGTVSVSNSRIPLRKGYVARDVSARPTIIRHQELFPDTCPPPHPRSPHRGDVVDGHHEVLALTEPRVQMPSLERDVGAMANQTDLGTAPQ